MDHNMKLDERVGRMKRFFERYAEWEISQVIRMKERGLAIASDDAQSDTGERMPRVLQAVFWETTYEAASEIGVVVQMAKDFSSLQ